MTARRFNSLLVFTVLGIIFSPKIFIRAQELTSGVPGKYLSASCAIFCSQCMKGIDVYGQGLSALCGKKNYEGIDACRLKCLEYEHPRVVGVALTLSLDCQSCLKESKCLNEQKKNFCQAIEKGRDMVEVSQYTRLKKIGAVPEGSTFGCPIGAEFSAETQKCQCPEGKELDSLHTVCLAKENIKAKIKLTLLLMPDDIRQKFYQAIKKMMEERIKDPKTGFLETIGLQVGLKALNDELIAEFLYEEIVKDTARLREFLKLLNELLKVTQPPEKPTLPPATPSSAEEVNWADWLEDFGNKLLIKAIGNCQPKKTPCMNKCKCERPYYVCGMKNIIECNTDCSVEIGCDACRKDEDCQRLSQEVGYKLKCTPLNNPDAPEVGVCGFVIPAVKL